MAYANKNQLKLTAKYDAYKKTITSPVSYLQVEWQEGSSGLR